MLCKFRAQTPTLNNTLFVESVAIRKKVCRNVAHSVKSPEYFGDINHWLAVFSYFIKSFESGIKSPLRVVDPVGLIHLTMEDGPDGPARYTWKRVRTAVHNLAIGSVWLENFGETQEEAFLKKLGIIDRFKMDFISSISFFASECSS